MKPKLSIGIFSIQNDIHALAVQHLLKNYSDVICYFFETDSLCNQASISWSNSGESIYSRNLMNKDNDYVNINELDVIWWRRLYRQQKVPDYITGSTHIDLINNDCKNALIGLVFNQFFGTWISEPNAMALAENKLIQLKVAEQVGFQVPRTLVSQNPLLIKQFCEDLAYEVIVKPVKGCLSVPLFAQMITKQHLASDEALMLCPAIYQEYIPGNEHIRVHCFGENVYSVLIESEILDWRANLDVPFSSFELDNETKDRLRSILKTLGLKMGVFDLKLNRNGQPIWLEVNPQGQFLFSEGLSGLDLTSAFVEFLYQEAEEAFKKKCLCRN